MPGIILGGEFEVVRPIGQGGMGTVYEAIQRTTGAPRAVKVMRGGLAADQRFRARFDQEARVSARIPSDHVVQVVRAGVDETTCLPWIAMELLTGQTMQAWLDGGGAGAGAAEVRMLLEQLCHALGAAHGVGVVHRDLKPENLFLSRSRVVGVPFVVKVLDFGVAKIVSEARGVTVAVGTPAYMAPEQTSASSEVGPQADVWALGLIVFRLLSGRPYWKALAAGDGGPVQLWREVLVDPLPPASERASEVNAPAPLPAGFDAWFARCVRREVEGRFADAKEAYLALRPLLEGPAPPTLVVGRGGGLEGATEMMGSTASVLPTPPHNPSSPAPTPPQARTALLSGAPGPLASGPLVSGAMAYGPAGSGPMASGPMVSGPMAYGPAGSGPMASGPAGSGPMASGPMASGPMASGPVVSAGGRATARVTFRERKERVVVEAGRGATLLEVALAGGLPHHHACGGRARCTTCRVVVLDGASSSGPRTEAEAKVAQARAWPGAIRLACQVRVLGDMTVRRLVVDEDDRELVNASISSEEPSVEQAVVASVLLPRFGEFAREQLPYDAVHVLNRYLRQLCEPALANRGAVLRYEPSGVLLSFGGDGGAGALEDATRSALRAQARAKQLNGYVLRHFGQQLEVVVGLHAGRLMRASVGHPSRTEQVVLGEAVEGAQAAARAAAGLGVGLVATRAAVERASGVLRLGQPVELGSFGAGVEVIDFMRPDVVLLVQSTFERLEGRWGAFSERFYEEFFELEPSVAPLFEGVDMGAQSSMLMDMLAMVIQGFENLERLAPTLRQLGARHVAYGARASHYKQAGRALLGALESFLGNDFTPEVHLAWMEVYGALAREMLEGSREAGG